MAGLTLILIGIVLIGYQIIYPSPAQLGQLRIDIAAGGSGSTAHNTLVWWPSAILIVVGAVLWKAGR